MLDFFFTFTFFILYHINEVKADEPCTQIFINEFHNFNNKQSETHDFIEIVGPAGTNVDDWLILTYDFTTQGNDSSFFCFFGSSF